MLDYKNSIQNLVGNSNQKVGIFDKLLEDRIVMLTNEVNDYTMTLIISQLLYLNAQDSQEPIHFYISSPGGSVTHGFAIIDTINLISAPVYTYSIGLVASMGALIHLHGDKKYILPNSELMLHQPLGGAQGQASDIEITANRILKMKDNINNIIATKTGRNVEDITKLIDRDKYFNAVEALEFGLVDEIIQKVD